MSTAPRSDFQLRYAEALHSYLSTQDEASLAVGHALGRHALEERISMLDIIEHHFELIDELGTEVDPAASLQFLLQTLTAQEFATRGFLDSTRGYAQERARADALADRDAFRTALVNSLQEGFFVADSDAVIIEINDAFTEITGYRADDLPYRWPYPWVTDEAMSNQRLSGLGRIGRVQYEVEIRHHDGHTIWVALNVNAVTAPSSGEGAYVGTLRDITAARAAASREGAVLRLATAVSIAKSVDDLLAVTLDECRTAIGAQRAVAVMWPAISGTPTVATAGEPAATAWNELEPLLQRMFQDARGRLPLTVQPVEWDGAAGQARGIIAVHSGAEDVLLWLEFSRPHAVSADDMLLITALVGQLSLGLQHVHQFEIARQTSLALQRAVLVPGAPSPGFAVHYEPAVAPLEIGGDWYDVLPIDEHRIGVVVGDCVGRGLAAATVMGQLRSSARALLLTGAEPATLLEQLDAVAALIPGAPCTTTLAAVLDTETGVMQYSSAGHLPAVLAAPGSAPTLLTDAHSVPLAVPRSDPRPQASQLLAPGSTLVCYTDGLVERRGGSIDAEIARLADTVLAEATSTVSRVADAVLRVMAPSGGYDDDVAIVVYRRPPEPLRIEGDAVLDRLQDVRHQLAGWLGAANIPAALSADIIMAANEVCSNGIEHAYRGQRPGKLQMTAGIADAQVRLQVTDFGSWKAPAPEPVNRGFGLPLIRAVTDRFELDHTGGGTTVNMSFKIAAE